MRRRHFLQMVALGAAPAFLPRAFGQDGGRVGTAFRLKRFALEEMGLEAMQNAMDTGRETATSIVKMYLSRIEDVDRRGPAINSVIELNPDALTIARALDQERKAKGPRGPLHGIPILLKDNIDTHDRMMTTAGSLALLGSIPPRDSFLAEKLREAGAVILGKTNLSEWANFRSTRSTSGWSGRGGQTKNPCVLDRNPSGSSSGSGAAVAANLCAAAIGTETNGSIVSPSSFCGIVGLKPTVGLVSRSGIIPIAQSQDTAGPMTRTVKDAAIVLGALAGADPRDAVPSENHSHSHRDYTVFLEASGLRGARIGVARRAFRTHPRAEKVIEDALTLMKREGAVVVDPADLPTHGKFGEAEFQVMLYEFKAGLNEYLAGLGSDAPVRTLAEVIEFNERNKEREMPHFGQELLLRAQEKGPLTDPAYLEARATCRRLARVEGIDAVMNEHRLDALVAPTTGPAHKTDFLYGNRSTGGSSSAAAVAGYPHITVPAGYVSELPVGISFFGRAYSEPTLLRLAYAFEQATLVRKAPRFLSTVG